MQSPFVYAIVITALSIVVVSYFVYYFIFVRQERNGIDEFQSTNDLIFYETDMTITPGIIAEINEMVGADVSKHIKTASVVRKFQVGSCSGLYVMGNREIKLIYVSNDKPGSGHMDDVFDWIQHSAQKENYNVRFVGVKLPAFRKHLIDDRGFMKKGNGELLKIIQ